MNEQKEEKKSSKGKNKEEKVFIPFSSDDKLTGFKMTKKEWIYWTSIDTNTDKLLPGLKEYITNTNEQKIKQDINKVYISNISLDLCINKNSKDLTQNALIFRNLDTTKSTIVLHNYNTENVKYWTTYTLSHSKIYNWQQNPITGDNTKKAIDFFRIFKNELNGKNSNYNFAPPVDTVVVFSLVLSSWDKKNLNRAGHTNHLVCKKTNNKTWRWFVIEPHGTINGESSTSYLTTWNNIDYIMERFNDYTKEFKLLPYTRDLLYYHPMEIKQKKSRDKLLYNYVIDTKTKNFIQKQKGVQSLFDVEDIGGYCSYFSIYILIIYLQNHTRISIRDAHSILVQFLSKTESKKPVSELSDQIVCILNLGVSFIQETGSKDIKNKEIFLIKERNDIFKTVELDDKYRLFPVRENKKIRDTWSKSIAELHRKSLQKHERRIKREYEEMVIRRRQHFDNEIYTRRQPGN
jgi:L-rhamnose mutarotase